MKRNIVIAVVAAAALVGGGTATALAVSGDDGRDAAPAARGADTGAGAGGRGAGAPVTAADAIGAALKEVPGTAVSAELDEEDDGDDAAVWEVDVLAGDDTWHSVRIDPADGGVLGSRADDDEDDTAEVRAALKGASVSAAEAAGAAADRGTVTSVELDDDGRDKGWEVETRASGGAGVSSGDGDDDGDGDDSGERDWRVGLTSGKVTADHDGADEADGADGSGDADDSDDSDDSGDSDSSDDSDD